LAGEARVSDDLDRRLEAIVRAAPTLMRVLEGARELDLPDWMIFSGAVYQRVLNHQTGRDPDYGVKDYDLGYFDASDISYEAEDVVVRRVAAAFEPPFQDMVEVRNQARVHVWFESKFGEPYGPLGRTADALERFVSPICAVGVRLTQNGRLEIAAPFGLEDIFALRMRPNPKRVRPESFARVAAGVVSRWPEVRVESHQGWAGPVPISESTLAGRVSPSSGRRR
jgi:hypothetical protein